MFKGIMLQMISVALVCGSLMAATQSPSPCRDCECSMRFYYQPENNNLYHWPLIFKQVPDHDPRVGKFAGSNLGRAVFISSSEMRNILSTLESANVSLKHSSAVKAFEPFKDLRHFGEMEIRVLSPEGTLESKLPPDRVCSTLQRIQPAIQAPRAAWEFQQYRVSFDCSVPGFDPYAYSDLGPKR